MEKYYRKNGGSRSVVVGLEEERRSANESNDGRRERGKNCPSFSSSLLDQIYRSMDGEGEEGDQLVLYTETAGGKAIKKQSFNYPTTPRTATSTSCKKEQLQDHAVGNEKWMEKKKATTRSSANQNKIILLNHHHHHNSTAAAAEYYPRRKSTAENGDQYSSCCRSSSGSSSGDQLFSSSEAESTSKTTSSSSCTNYRPKPIRTGSSTHTHLSSSTCTTNHDQLPQKHKQTSSIAAGTSIFRNQEMKLLVKKRLDEKHQQGSSSTKSNNSGEHFSKSKSKSKALKFYADLKKVKQPLSPGGKLASFLNSIFNNNNNNNKAKMTLVSSNEEEVISKSKYSAQHHASTCSLASSFSRTRSCLSKSSTTNPTPTTSMTCKRSVRFYPLATVIVDGKYCLQTTTAASASASQWDKRNNNKDSGIREIMNWRGEEVARDLFKSSYHKRSCKFKNTNIMDIDHEEEDYDDDDAASCASSDLFELDHNLNSHHAFEMYGEELPVYETTYFDTNPTIANGLIM